MTTNEKVALVNMINVMIEESHEANTTDINDMAYINGMYAVMHLVECFPTSDAEMIPYKKKGETDA